MAYKYIFGPVPSRRLGISLGLDITPDKSCTFNCIYCECGKTEELTTERRAFVPTADIIAELTEYLSTNPRLDAITFSGSGEPTLHAGFGEIIGFLKTNYPQYRVAVLTNSSLLHLPEVRAELARADLVVPSLDAVSEESFLKINRPKSTLDIETMIEGLRTFTREFTGEIWMEIFIVPGVNDMPAEIARFREVLETMRFDKVQLNTLDRPAVVDWLEAASPESMEAFAHKLGVPAEIVARKRTRQATPGFNQDLSERILATIRIRPCTLVDVCDSLGIHEHEAAKYLDSLIATNQAELVRREHTIFYRGK